MPIIVEDDVLPCQNWRTLPMADVVMVSARFGQIVRLIFGFNVFVSEPMPMMRHRVRHSHQASSMILKH